jgi:ethanolamine utilization protein EutA
VSQPEISIESEERVELMSVGVDIGSATSHMVFSKITVEKRGTRYVTVGREALYESPIILTPYNGLDLIDPEALEKYVEAQFEFANLSRDEVDTGALILTGVALDRANSRTIGDVFAREAGKMVAVSAGDNMECVLAAKGSGALAYSEALDGDLLNIDIGGGTAKMVICRSGGPVANVAVDVGARLIVTDDDGVIVRLEQAGTRAGHALGTELAVGTVITDADKEKIAGYLADELLAAARVTGDGHSALLRGEPLPAFTVAALSFSGGVSEYIYRRQLDTFNDLGPFLAAAVLSRLNDLSIPLVEYDAPGIRATVLGASQYTVQLSGSTIYVSEPGSLPVRNIQVIAPAFDLAELSAAGISSALERSLAGFDLKDSKQPVAISYRWDGLATYARIDEFCRGIAAGIAARDQDAGSPIVLVSEDDIGRLIGSHLATECVPDTPVISVDCVETGDFAFVDIGQPIAGAASVPVVIKSLIFPAATAS